MSSLDWCADISRAAAAAAAPSGEEICCELETEGNQASAGEAMSTAVRPAPAPASKVIMWLGSSIGNSTRAEGAAFLFQLKEAAMQPGASMHGYLSAHMLCLHCTVRCDGVPCATLMVELSCSADCAAIS
jgi:hypothetical protein